MSDMTIQELCDKSHETAKEKGWWKDGIENRNFGEILMLSVTELAETFEEFRVNGLNPEKMIYIKDGKPEGVAVELADLFIRMGDNCKAFNIPIVEAIRLKMEYNKNRPYRHGGKLA